jgi:hypothetical protein
MKIGMIALFAALVMMAAPVWAGAPDCDSGDTDSDGVCNPKDNCLVLANAGASGCDTDSDGYGNLCDGDFDQDGFVTAGDFTSIWLGDFSPGGLDTGTGTDMDCDGFVTAGDFTGPFIAQFTGGGLPGPSGLSCAGTAGCGAFAQN